MKITAVLSIYINMKVAVATLGPPKPCLSAGIHGRVMWLGHIEIFGNVQLLLPFLHPNWSIDLGKVYIRYFTNHPGLAWNIMEHLALGLPFEGFRPTWIMHRLRFCAIRKKTSTSILYLHLKHGNQINLSTSFFFVFFSQPNHHLTPRLFPGWITPLESHMSPKKEQFQPFQI